MEKGRGKRTDTLQTDKVFTRKEYTEREKVVELLNKWADGYSYIEVPTKDAIACVRAIPAADVVPVRHGKWETAFLAHEYLGCRPYAHYCSVCHQIIAFRTFYCPNCGARMDGDGDA